MNLHITKSKNAESFYICKSYVKATGSTTSTIVRKRRVCSIVAQFFVKYTIKYHHDGIAVRLCRSCTFGIHIKKNCLSTRLRCPLHIRQDHRIRKQVFLIPKKGNCRLPLYYPGFNSIINSPPSFQKQPLLPLNHLLHPLHILGHIFHIGAPLDPPAGIHPLGNGACPKRHDTLDLLHN